jgi:hypothetical protein
MRLGAALHYFTGGSPYDIMCVFCISYSEVLKSVWVVIDAINHCPQFHNSYPSSLEEQHRITAECYSASTPKFRNCTGAIDGILIWTEKPSLTEAKSVGVDQKNSYAVASTSLVLIARPSLTVAAEFLTFQSSVEVLLLTALLSMLASCTDI